MPRIANLYGPLAYIPRDGRLVLPSRYFNLSVSAHVVHRSASEIFIRYQLAGWCIFILMQGQAPQKERILVWQMSLGFNGNDSIECDCFSCTVCSWTFPNPKALTQEQHDMTAVDSRFAGHVCSRNLPRKKFKL